MKPFNISTRNHSFLTLWIVLTPAISQVLFETPAPAWIFVFTLCYGAAAQNCALDWEPEVDHLGSNPSFSSGSKTRQSCWVERRLETRSDVLGLPCSGQGLLEGCRGTLGVWKVVCKLLIYLTPSLVHTRNVRPC